MAEVLEGPSYWALERDREGHREITVRHKVRAEITEGPKAVLDATGLPQVGDIWVFDDDEDFEAYCTPLAKVTPVLFDQPNMDWVVEQVFSTRAMTLCQDEVEKDPLLIPARISGSFVTKSEEAVYDRFGKLIVNSSHEQVRGPMVEFDVSLPVVVIEQNVLDLEFEVLAKMTDTLNDSELWGIEPRGIKMSRPSWERKFYGQCYVYFVRKLQFEVNVDAQGSSKWDRMLPDEGTMVLNGAWDNATGAWVLKNIGTTGLPPNPADASHYCQYIDRNGNKTKVMLNGAGTPSGVRVSIVGFSNANTMTIRVAAANVANLAVQARTEAETVLNSLRAVFLDQVGLPGIPAFASSVMDRVGQVVANATNSANVSVATQAVVNAGGARAGVINSISNSIVASNFVVGDSASSLGTLSGAVGGLVALIPGGFADAADNIARLAIVTGQLNTTCQQAATSASVLRALAVTANASDTVAGGLVSDKGTIRVEKYEASNFLLLDVPVDINQW